MAKFSATHNPNETEVIMTRRRWMAIAATTVAGLSGCGSKDGLSRVAVSGKIVANGQPVDGCHVRFIPVGSTKGPGASAMTDANGAFVLEDDRGNHGGIVPGDYKVAVSRMARPDGKPLPLLKTNLDFPDAKETMPHRVTSADNSPLTHTVTVDGGDAVIEIPESLFKEKRPLKRAGDDEL